MMLLLSLNRWVIISAHPVKSRTLVLVFLISGVLLSCLAFTAQAEESTAFTETSLKVLTWNVQMLPTLFGSMVNELDKLQNERAAWIIAHLRQQDFDLVCLQEMMDFR